MNLSHSSFLKQISFPNLSKLCVYDYHNSGNPPLSPGKMDSQQMQVENLGVLITLFGEVLRTLALTSDDLHSLSSRSNKDASRCKFLTTWSPNQVNVSCLATCQPMKYSILAKQDKARSLETIFFDLYILVASHYGTL